MSDGLLGGFGRRRLPGDGVEIDALVGFAFDPKGVADYVACTHTTSRVVDCIRSLSRWAAKRS